VDLSTAVLSSTAVASLSLPPSSTSTAATTAWGTAGKPVAPVATSVAGGWDGSAPFYCGGEQEWTLSGVTATFPDKTAISVAGACKLHLMHVHVSGRVGLYAAAAAEVTIDDSTIEGTNYAIDLGGHAHVKLHATTVTGRIDQGSHGTIDRN
jgi:hypothetical protein